MKYSLSYYSIFLFMNTLFFFITQNFTKSLIISLFISLTFLTISVVMLIKKPQIKNIGYSALLVVGSLLQLLLSRIYFRPTQQDIAQAVFSGNIDLFLKTQNFHLITGLIILIIIYIISTIILLNKFSLKTLITLSKKNYFYIPILVYLILNFILISININFIRINNITSVIFQVHYLMFLSTLITCSIYSFLLYNACKNIKITEDTQSFVQSFDISSPKIANEIPTKSIKKVKVNPIDFKNKNRYVRKNINVLNIECNRTRRKLKLKY